MTSLNIKAIFLAESHAERSLPDTAENISNQLINAIETSRFLKSPTDKMRAVNAKKRIEKLIASNDKNLIPYIIRSVKDFIAITDGLDPIQDFEKIAPKDKLIKYENQKDENIKKSSQNTTELAGLLSSIQSISSSFNTIENNKNRIKERLSTEDYENFIKDMESTKESIAKAMELGKELKSTPAANLSSDQISVIKKLKDNLYNTVSRGLYRKADGIIRNKLTQYETKDEQNAKAFLNGKWAKLSREASPNELEKLLNDENNEKELEIIDKKILTNIMIQISNYKKIKNSFEVDSEVAKVQAPSAAPTGVVSGNEVKSIEKKGDKGSLLLQKTPEELMDWIASNEKEMEKLQKEDPELYNALTNKAYGLNEGVDMSSKYKKLILESFIGEDAKPEFDFGTAEDLDLAETPEEAQRSKRFDKYSDPAKKRLALIHAIQNGTLDDVEMEFVPKFLTRVASLINPLKPRTDGEEGFIINFTPKDPNNVYSKGVAQKLRNFINDGSWDATATNPKSKEYQPLKNDIETFLMQKVSVGMDHPGRAIERMKKHASKIIDKWFKERHYDLLSPEFLNGLKAEIIAGAENKLKANMEAERKNRRAEKTVEI